MTASIIVGTLGLGAGKVPMGGFAATIAHTLLTRGAKTDRPPVVEAKFSGISPIVEAWVSFEHEGLTGPGTEADFDLNPSGDLYSGRLPALSV